MDLIKGAFEIFFQLLTGILGTAMAIMNGDWEKAWFMIKETFVQVGGTIVDTGKAVFERLHNIVTSIVGRTEEYITSALTRIKDTLREIVSLGRAQTATFNPTTPNMSIAGAKAGGGYVGMGQTYLVGERGPELFTPKQAGNITPNGQFGGSGVTVEINFGGVSVRNDQDIQKLTQEVAKELTRQLETYKL